MVGQRSYTQLASFGLCFEWTSINRVAKIMMTLLEWLKNNTLCIHCQYYNTIIMMLIIKLNTLTFSSSPGQCHKYDNCYISIDG